jgi:hypothetical protein
MYTVSMKPKHFYLILCVLGVVLPYSQLVPLMLEHQGFDVIRFFQEVFVNRSSSFIAMDLTVTALTFFVFLFTEGKIRKYPAYVIWVPLATVFMVGVSLGFPLFLYLREREEEKVQKTS